MVIYALNKRDFEKKIYETQKVKIHMILPHSAVVLAPDKVFRRVHSADTVDEFIVYLKKNIKIKRASNYFDIRNKRKEA